MLLAGYIIIGIIFGVAVYTLGCEQTPLFSFSFSFPCFGLSLAALPCWVVCERAKRDVVKRDMEKRRRR